MKYGMGRAWDQVATRGRVRVRVGVGHKGRPVPRGDRDQGSRDAQL